MTINEAYKYIQGKARQNQVGHIPTETLNIYFERAQLEVVDELWGNKKEYQPGRPVPTTGGFERNQTVADELSSLVTRTPTQVVSMPIIAGGLSIGRQLDKPSDYIHLVRLASTYFKNSPSTGSELRWVDVDVVTHAEKAERLGSQIKYPTYQYPIAVQYDTFFEVIPTNIQSVDMIYLRKPVKPIWAYTVVSGQQVYDSGNSTDFELAETVHNEICEKVLSYIGLSTRDQLLFQGSENQQNKGV